MAKSATARKDSVPSVKSGHRGGPVHTLFGPGNPGRPKGTLNKTTKALLLAAHELCRPLATRFIEKGEAHMLKCEVTPCDECWRYGTFAFAYAHGKPKETIDIDMPLLRAELEKLAIEVGRPIEEIEREAERMGAPLLRVVGR